MRVQEHIYQGYFGNKKKQDSAKYYKERIEKLKGFDSTLDEAIEAFQKILENHKVKLKSYQEFLNNPSEDKFKTVRLEVEKLEGMYDEDELANDRGKKYVLKGIEKLEEMTKEEESSELTQVERQEILDLKELMSLLKSIEPIWQAQIDFMKKSNDEILRNRENIQELSKIFSNENTVLRMEENLLRKIDMQTGALLRKATLKGQNIKNTEDMDLRYREMKNIR